MAKAYVARLRGCSEGAAVGVAIHVMAGGQLAEERRRDASYAVEEEWSGHCPRRGAELETMAHRVWKCPRNGLIRHRDIDESAG